MAAPLFQHEHGVFYTWVGGVASIFFSSPRVPLTPPPYRQDADAFRALAWNIAGCLTIIMWSLAWAGLMFAILHHQKLLRIEEQVELMVRGRVAPQNTLPKNSRNNLKRTPFPLRHAQGIDEAVHNGFAYFLKASRRNANAAQLPSPDIAEPTVEESV